MLEQGLIEGAKQVPALVVLAYILVRVLHHLAFLERNAREMMEGWQKKVGEMTECHVQVQRDTHVILNRVSQALGGVEAELRRRNGGGVAERDATSQEPGAG